MSLGAKQPDSTPITTQPSQQNEEDQQQPTLTTHTQLETDDLARQRSVSDTTSTRKVVSSNILHSLRNNPTNRLRSATEGDNAMSGSGSGSAGHKEEDDEEA